MRCTLGRERKPICERPTHARRAQGSVVAAGDGAGPRGRREELQTEGGAGDAHRSAPARSQRTPRKPRNWAWAYARRGRARRQSSSAAAPPPLPTRFRPQPQRGERPQQPSHLTTQRLTAPRAGPQEPQGAPTRSGGATQPALRQTSMPSRAHAGAAWHCSAVRSSPTSGRAAPRQGPRRPFSRCSGASVAME